MKSPLVCCVQITSDCEFLLTSSRGRRLLFHTGAVGSKASRSSQGVAVMSLRRGDRLFNVREYVEGLLKNPDRYRKKIPAAGSFAPEGETGGEQLTF